MEIIRIGNIYGKYKGGSYAGNVYDPEGLSPAILALGGGNSMPLIIEEMDIQKPKTCAIRTRKYAGIPATLEVGGEVANALTSVPKDSMVLEPMIISYSRDHNGQIVGHHLKNIANTLCPGNLGCTRNTAQYVAHPQVDTQYPKYRIRKLTPRECFRLMDVKDADIDKIQGAGISKTQQYKLAGNSVVVSCLYYLLRNLLIDEFSNQPLN